MSLDHPKSLSGSNGKTSEADSTKRTNTQRTQEQLALLMQKINNAFQQAGVTVDMPTTEKPPKAL